MGGAGGFICIVLDFSASFLDKGHKIKLRKVDKSSLINKTEDILTFVDSIDWKPLAREISGKDAVKHKKTCGWRKTVVILQPQTGTKPRRRERKQRENIDNNATGQ